MKSLLAGAAPLPPPRRALLRLAALPLLALLLLGAIAPAPVTAAPILDQQYQPDPTSTTFLIADVDPLSNSRESSAQSFTAGRSGPLSQVDVLIRRNTALSLGPVVEISAASGGVPSGDVLASATIPPALLSTTYSWVAVSFATPASVSAGQQYAIILRPPDGAQAPWNVRWQVDESGSYAGGGGARRLGNGPWRSDAGFAALDAGFRTYVAEAAPQLDLAITKTDGQTRYTPGSALTYTLTVTNAGPATATGASVTDALPAALVTVAATCAATGTATCGTNASSANTVSFTGVSLAAGAANLLTITISATVHPSTTGDLVNTATVTAPAGTTDTNLANNTATDTDTPGPPTITSISPNYGPATGGTLVSITGSGFSTDGGTRFVGGPAEDLFTDVVCTTTSTCQATSIAQPGTTEGSATSRPVSALVAGQRSSTDPPIYFTWYGRPILSSLSPSSGPPAGGTSVTLVAGVVPHGPPNFPGPVTIRFGATTIERPDGCPPSGTCVITAPPGTGTVQVTIETPGGISNALPYTYVAAPTITRITPSSGPPMGGTPVTITGSGFQAGASVRFGGVAASVSSVSPTTITASSPPHAPGAVAVTVTNPGPGSQPATLANGFTYLSAAQVMTVTATVWGVQLLPGGSGFTGTAVPVVGAQVQALVGGTVCGQGVTDSQGQVQLSVVADPPVPGCGRNGALVSFRVNGQAVVGGVTFVPGGSGSVFLPAP